MLSRSFLEIIQSNIFDKYHLPLMKEPTTEDKIYEFLTPQQSYGVLSACRRAALVNIFFNVLSENIPEAANLITSQDLFYLQVVALFAHSVWENKLNDEGILAIKVNCQKFLESIGVKSRIAHQFVKLLDSKNVPQKDSKQYWLKIILDSADSLNNMRRANTIYFTDRIPLTAELANLDKQGLIEKLAKDVLDMMVQQHDINRAVQLIDKKTFQITYEVKAQSKKKIKQGYELSKNCYEKVINDIKQFPILSQYYKTDAFPSQAVVLLEDIKKKQRDEIRNVAPRIEIENDFIFKSVRGDNANYFLKFLDGITPPFKHHPLRFDNKKEYTVNGRGIYLRSEKKSTYSKEQKKLYSKKQSTTYGMPDLQPNPFNFSGETVKTVGVIFFDITKNVLLSDHLITHDAGTTGRPNDFNFLPPAEQFFKQRINKILFSKEQIAAFKDALRKDKDYKYHNEVLAHLRFTADDSCQLFINVDTLEARLLAQTYAKMIYARLSEANACPADYEIKICYYNPTSSFHLKQYTKREQELDQSEAAEILQNDEMVVEKALENNFEFLFFLDPKRLIEHLNKKVDQYSLVTRILSQGYQHILDFFVELKMLDALSLEKLIAEQIEGVNDAKTLLQIAYYAIKKDKFSLFQKVLVALSKHPDYANQINAVVDLPDCKENLLQFAMYLKKSDYINALSNLEHININQANPEGNNILHYAALTGDVKYVRQALQLGADVNATNNKKITALHHAIANGDCDSVRFLLSQAKFIQLDIKAEVSNGWFTEDVSYLEIAARYDQAEVLKILHDDGRFDFSKNYHFNRTLLSIAEDSPLTQLYLLSLPEIDFKKQDIKNYMGGQNGLHKAASHGFVDVVKILLAKGMPVNDTTRDIKETALHCAVGSRNFNPEIDLQDRIEIIKLLLAAGIDRNAVNSAGESALGIAIKNNNAPLIKFLVENGCSLKGIAMPMLEATLTSSNHAIPKLIQYEAQNTGKKLIQFFKPGDAKSDSVAPTESKTFKKN